MERNFITQYTIYCTTEQTKKALELGATLIEDRREWFNTANHVCVGDIWYYCPTAEQMIGWLEDGKFREINVQEFGNFWEYNLYTSSGNTISRKGNYTGNYTSRSEATIDAIDAALEYLEAQKK